MRISDWSSDVCSSDLNDLEERARARRGVGRQGSDVEALAHFLAGLEIGNAFGRDIDRIAGAGIAPRAGFALARGEGAKAAQFHEIGRASCRESVCQYV